MSFPFAPGPKRDGIFAEVVFGSLGLGVLASTLLTLGTTPAVSESAVAPAAVAAAVWSDEVVTHLVDVSGFAEALAEPAPEEAAPEEAAPEPAPEGEAEEAVPEDRAPAREIPSARGEAEPEAVPAKGGEARPAKKGRRCTEPTDPAIVTTGPGRWTIDQSVVRRYTRDWSRLDQLGWSQSHKDAQGRSDGLELGGIRCGSDIHDAGFRNGDVIHAVNGRKVHSIPQALMAYTALHNDETFSVEITRRGKRQVLTYRLVD
jgi:hypothetical protein